MNFCSHCGHSTSFGIPEGDQLPRFFCSQCNTIHYQNPRIITGTLPIAPDGQVMLCLRNIEPRKNYWTLPGGFMENGESTLEGALRETYEESRLAVNTGSLLSVISLPNWNQVHLFYKVNMPDYNFATTPESSKVELFQEPSIPWDQLAFKTVERTLKHYFAHKNATIPVLNDSISPL